jgi:alpha,alpha-trehalase
VPDHDLQPLERLDGYLPIERHALIGDCAGSALVAADGTIPWMCVPRFDSEALAASLLDTIHGGRLRVAPLGVEAAAQWYREHSAVVVTELRTADATLRLTDCMALEEGADLHETARHTDCAFIRHVEVLHGETELVVDLEPRGGASFERTDAGLAIRWLLRPDLGLHVDTSRRLDGPHTTLAMRAGEEFWFRLRWGDLDRIQRPTEEPADALRRTDATWREWCRAIPHDGPASATVERSAITLKLLDHAESGALVAAPTSSLPETIGGVRNWDYRYVWIRDAAFCVHALRRIGMEHEALDYVHWVLCAVERAGRAGVLYDLDGTVPTVEHEDPLLEGYRGSAPVRWGNDAANQRQNDAFGEIVDSAWQWVSAADGSLSTERWSALRALVERAADVWDQPDHGIWEIRAPDRLFTYSVAMCEVALDRGARLARRLGLPGDIAGWETLARHLRELVITDAWDDDKGALTETLGPGGGLDASVLALSLREVVPADHPRMVATCEAVVRELGSGNGLIHRYDPAVSDDGLPGEEGAFLLCTSWWIDNLILQGRHDQAVEEFERLCARGGTLGLLPEQIDPATGAFLGNYPQAFSHVGLLSNAVLLSRHLPGAGS